MAAQMKNRLLLALVLAALTPMAFGQAATPRKAERQTAAEQRKADRGARKTATQADPQTRQDARQSRMNTPTPTRPAPARTWAQPAQPRAAQQQRDRAAEQRATARQAAAANARQAPAAAPDRAQQRDQRQQDRAAKRLSSQQQQQMITQQKSRVVQYRQYTSHQREVARTVAAQLQAQKRMQQYQYVNDYNQRVLAQQQRYSSQSFNYSSDPYFYSSPIYRYQRDGQYYMLNQYGANLLNQAINDGYSEGFHAGRADRMDHWRSDYQNSFAYQDASFGYSGYYLDRGDYSYYFRQGFRRGYEDGYYDRYQYGVYRNGNYSIVGAVLSTILNLQSY